MSDAANSTPNVKVLDAGHVPDGPDADFDPLALAEQQEAAERGKVTSKIGGKQNPAKAPTQKVTPNVQLGSSDADEEAALEEAPEEEFQEEEQPEEEFDLKVNGKVLKVKGIEGLKAAAQRGIAEQQARQRDRAELQRQMAELKQMAEAAKARLEMSPEELFRAKYGDKAEDAMEQILLDRAKEAAQLAQMTPRERELYQARKADQAKLAEYEKAKAEQAKKADEELVQTQRKQIEGVFSEALTKHNLPVTNATVRIMAGIYKANLDAGNAMTAPEAADATRKQILTMFTEVTKGMKPADFVAAFPDLAKAVRSHFVQAKQGVAVGDPSEAPPRRQVTPTKRKPISSQEAWEREYKKLLEQGDRDLQRINNR